MYRMLEVMERKGESRKSLGIGGPGEVSQGEGAFKSTNQIFYLVQSIKDRFIFFNGF